MYKILLTGPESTGKTTLAKRLAEVYQTAWVPEYAREYLEKFRRSYTHLDLLYIAKGQQEREKKMSANAQEYLFFDTSFLNLKIWSYYKYEKCHPFIELFWNKAYFDLVLLCGTEVPWEEDPLRESQHEREILYDIYKKELKEKGLFTVELKGSVKERVEKVKTLLA